jgi:hypothetical protein
MGGKKEKWHEKRAYGLAEEILRMFYACAMTSPEMPSGIKGGPVISGGVFSDDSHFRVRSVIFQKPIYPVVGASIVGQLLSPPFITEPARGDDA